jgi:hypothetical protein
MNAAFVHMVENSPNLGGLTFKDTSLRNIEKPFLSSLFFPDDKDLRSPDYSCD